MENYNLFSNVNTPFNGIVGHGAGNSITGTVAFADETTYQLSSSSAAIDMGANLGVTTDYFGATRPQGSGPDIGYAESPFVAAFSCYATPNNGTTLYGSNDASAVQSAVDSVTVGGTVKVAGTCAGTNLRGGLTQTLYISQSLTLQGGYTTTNWITSNLVANPTILDAMGSGRVITANVALTVSNLKIQNGKWRIANQHGGGIYANQPITLSNVIVYSNTVTGTNGSGGGVRFNSTASVTGTTFLSNTARSVGGGAYFVGTASVTGTTFLSNMASGSAGGALFNGTTSVTGTTFSGNTASGFGGGAYFLSTGSVTGTTFSSNMASGFGGGAYFQGTASVTRMTFNSNTALFGGGAVFASTASVMGTAFSGNSASDGGGAAFNDTASVTGTTFSGNSASGGSGGGAYFGGSTMQLVNVLFSRNWATVNGAAVYVDSASPSQLIHTTITSPTVPIGAAEAVYLNAGTLYLTNTIIASHTIGIQQVGGTVVENYNLFSNIDTPFGGTVGHGAGNSITGTVAFADETSYQLSSSSAAIDMGTNLGITTDYFGNIRPQSILPDLGYAESSYLFTRTVQLSGMSYSGNEMADGVVITALLDVPSTYYISITVASGDNTANSSSDYIALNQTLTFTPNTTLVTFTVPITNDTLYEGDETLTLTLSAPINASVGANSLAMVTIVNDDIIPTVAIADSSVSEAAGMALFTVTLSGASAADTGMSYSSSNDTATAGSDYTASSGVLTLTAGFTQGVISVPIMDDLLDENNETFSLTLSGAVNGTFSDGQATGTIVDNDAGNLWVSAISGNTSESGITASFTIRLNSAPTATVTIALTRTDVTEGDIVSTSLTFDSTNWNVPQTVVVTGLDDVLQDGAQSYMIIGTTSSSDPAYNSLYINVVVINQDNDAPLNGSPIARGELYQVNQDSVLTVTASGVLGNDNDPENNPITVLLATMTSHGTLTLNGNGSFIYTPTVGYVGADYFIYVANDGNSNSNAATVTITVKAIVPTVTITPTATVTVTPTMTMTATPIMTATITPTATITATPTMTVTATPTATTIPTVTATPIMTATPTPDMAVTPTITVISTVTATPSPTATVVGTATPMATATPTLTVIPTIITMPTVTSTPERPKIFLPLIMRR